MKLPDVQYNKPNTVQNTV